jgi:hypothetical protein
LEITLQSPFIFPVSAGFIFSGEEKNCEKLGSCAKQGWPTTSQKIIATAHLNLFIIQNLLSQ